MTKRIVLMSLCLAVASTVLLSVLVFFDVKRDAAKTVQEYLNLEAQLKLPAEYCLENENLIISANELEKIKLEFVRMFR